ncbi:MAG: replicative DNA helicase [bacterium]|nr:replicative DNA helicase [bacterium]
MLPPQSLEAEQAVLGTILLQADALNQVVEIIRADDFYRENHRVIFTAMLTLFDRREPHDLITVGTLLADQSKLESAGGAAYLASLTDVIPFTGTLVHHARLIRQKSVLRQLIRTSSELAARCYDAPHDIDALIDDAERTIFEIAHAKSGQAFQSIGQIVPGTFTRISEQAERGDSITGTATGYADLDRMTAGLQPADMVVLAARPSMGKTALAMNIVQNVAVIKKVPVAVFSLEMSAQALAMRMLCSVGKIDSQRLRTGRLQDSDWPRLQRATAQLSEAPIYIDDTSGMTALEMRAKSRRLKAEHDLGLIVVDYLQLMQGRGNSENRVQEISEISRSLKAMAKELDVPVLALSQLNRSLEHREDRRPQLSDLRESGAIEQDADVILFIYRDEVYNKSETNKNRGIAEIIIGKQRNGPTGTVRLSFLGQYASFEQFTQRDDLPTQLPPESMMDPELWQQDMS